MLGVVVISLLLLLIVPLRVNATASALRARIAEGMVAKQHLSDLQTALALEGSALNGYLIGGDRRFLTRYRASDAAGRRGLTALEEIGKGLGPEPTAAIMAIRAAEAHWSAGHAALVEGRDRGVPNGELLARQQARFEEVTHATRRLDAVIARSERALRARIAATERTAAWSSALLASLTLASVLLALRFGRRLGSSLAAETRTRKWAQDELHDTEARYRHLVETSPYAVLVHVDDRVVYANPAAGALLGAASPAELIDTAVEEHLGARDPEGALARMTDVPGVSGTAERAREQLLRKDGSRVEAEVASAPVRYAGRDAVQLIARDVSQQIRADEALRRSERRFRSLVEHIHDPLVVLEGDGTVLFASPATEATLGIAPGRLRVEDLSERLHPDDVDAAREAYDRALRFPGTPQQRELRVRHADGKWRVMDTVGTSLLHDPDVAAIIINARDVTERRAAETALTESQAQLFQAQKMEAVGKLAGGIAHDFNNLLTAIKGNAQMLLLEIPDGSRLRDDVQEIDRAATRAAALTSQLLAFSRRQVLHPEVLDLNAVVTSLDRMLRRVLGSDVEIATVLGAGVGSIRADPVQFEQVLVNLAVNARDAMPGGGRLQVETRPVVFAQDEVLHPTMPPGRYALLQVSDTGTGIPPEHLGRVFEPFFTTKEVGRGTGLGLSTVYGVVKQSGGWIWVDSEVGQGTSFRIYLPVVDAAPRKAPEEPVLVSAAVGSETVLLAEDNDAVRRLARRTLEAKGYHVLEAANGDEALHHLAQHGGEVDLLLTDLVMPLVGGRELAARVKKERPDIAVIFISGYTDEAVLRTEVFEPGTEFLQKPFAPETLAHRVRMVLDARRSRRQGLAARAEGADGDESR